jgi:hypothetical protein
VTELTDEKAGWRGWHVWWPCLVLVLVSAGLRVPLLMLEFGRNAEGTGALYGIAAENYLTRGGADSLWMPVLSVGGAEIPPTVYAHHPPTVPLVLAASWAVFGQSDWAARLPWMLMTLGCVAAVYGLVLRSGGGRAGAAMAAAVMALLPFSLRFGQMPDVINSMLVLGVLLLVWASLRVVERPTAGTVTAVGLALLGALLVDWPAFFMAVVLGAGLVIGRPRGWVKLGVGLAVVSVGVFVGLVVWASVARGDWGVVWQQFLNRVTQSKLDDQSAFGWRDWFVGVWGYLRPQFTPAVLLAAVVGMGLALWSGGGRMRVLVALLAGWALVHAVVGRQGALNHDWWWWPLLPLVCVGVGAAVGRLPCGPLRKMVVCGALGWLGWLAYGEMRHLLSPFWTYNAISQYAVKELGEAIRIAPGSGAVMTFTDERQPYLHYYTRRPTIERTWTPADVERNLRATRTDLFYSFTQELHPPATAYLFPKAWELHGAGLLAWLRERYPVRDAGAFWVFDLSARR